MICPFDKQAQILFKWLCIILSDAGRNCPLRSGISNALDLPTTGHRSIVAAEYRTAGTRDVLGCRLLAPQSAESRGNGYLRGKATSTLAPRLSLISARDTAGEQPQHMRRPLRARHAATK